MRQNNSFDWRTLGKADYSQAAALVASLPSDVRSQIKGVSDEILRRLVYLMWRYAEHSGRGNAYCWPALKTIAGYCDRTVRTVQRHLERLGEAGLIVAKQRTKGSGEHTSNLYQLGATFLASLFARGKRKSPIKPATTKMSHNDLKREYKADAPIERGERLTDFLVKLRANRPVTLEGQLVGSATDSWDE